MLVLSRKQTECVVINDKIVVTVLSVRGNTVRLGVEAPREIPVLRSELDRRQTVGLPPNCGHSSTPHRQWSRFLEMTLTLAQLFRPGAHSGIPSFTNHSNVVPTRASPPR